MRRAAFEIARRPHSRGVQSDGMTIAHHKKQLTNCFDTSAARHYKVCLASRCAQQIFLRSRTVKSLWTPSRGGSFQ